MSRWKYLYNCYSNRVTVSVTSVTFSKKGFSKGKNAEIIKLYSSLKKVVQQGNQIGTMSDNGTPGNVHLHFEIREDGLYAGAGGTGNLVDPLEYLPSEYSK